MHELEDTRGTKISRECNNRIKQKNQMNKPKESMKGPQSINQRKNRESSEQYYKNNQKKSKEINETPELRYTKDPIKPN